MIHAVKSADLALTSLHRVAGQPDDISTDPLIGRKLDGRYTLESLVGEGGTGRVYRARQEATGREVAVKLLRDSLVQDEDSVRRFRREAMAACRINHPNTITVHDFGCTQEGHCYLVTELMEGETLQSLMDRQGVLPPDAALAIFEQIVAGMQAAHERGVVHRDLHPGNIFVSMEERGELHVKIFDFGGARLMDPSIDTDVTGTNHVDLKLLLASTRYLAPERMQRDFRPDPRCDVYSLGLILFELCTGQHPFDNADPLQVMAMHLREPPPLLSVWSKNRWFSPALQGLVTSMLAKDPSLRPADAHDVAMRLAVAQDSDSLILESEEFPEPDVEIEMEALPADEALERSSSSMSLQTLSEEAPPVGIGVHSSRPLSHPASNEGMQAIGHAAPAAYTAFGRPSQIEINETVIDLQPVGRARVCVVSPERVVEKQTGSALGRNPSRIFLAALCMLLGAVIVFSLGALGYRAYQRWHQPPQQPGAEYAPGDEPAPAPLRP